jgi:integrase
VAAGTRDAAALPAVPPTGAQASARMLELVRAHHLDESKVEQDDDERRRRGLTFRDLGHEWLHFLQYEKGAKTSTLTGYRQMLSEPGVPHLRGRGKTPGRLMEHFGNRRAQEITTREVADYLRALERAGASPHKVNRHRQVISAMYGYAMREDSHAFEHNPARGTFSSWRREPPPAVLDFYEPEEIETLARAAERGEHRNVLKLRYDAAETAARDGENRQDADLYRVAAYTGLRLGELRALRWGDVNLVERRLVVQRLQPRDRAADQELAGPLRPDRRSGGRGLRPVEHARRVRQRRRLRVLLSPWTRARRLGVAQALPSGRRGGGPPGSPLPRSSPRRRIDDRPRSRPGRPRRA